MFMLGLMIRFEVDRNKLAKVARLIGLRVVVSAVASVLAFSFLPFDATTRIVIVMLLWAPASAMGPTFTLWSDGDFGLGGARERAHHHPRRHRDDDHRPRERRHGIKKAPRRR